MKRRMPNVLAVVSLLLSVATALLWARSYLHSDMIRSTSGSERDSIVLLAYSGRGGIMVRGACVASPPGLRHGFYYREHDPAYPSQSRLLSGHQWTFLGFGARHDWGTHIGSSIDPSFLQWVIRWDYGVWVPHWFVVLLGGLPAVGFLMLRSRRVRRRRLRLGLCLACGYDLRASTERCPECGTPIPPVAGATKG